MSFIINKEAGDKMSISNGVIKQKKVYKNADGTYKSTETYSATFEDNKDINGQDLSQSLMFDLRLKSATYRKIVDDSDNDENDEDVTVIMASGDDSRVDIILSWD